MNETDVLLYGVGDLHPNREDPESAVALAVPTLKKADIRFGQLETHFSVRGEDPTHHVLRTNPNGIRTLTNAGFDVISFASNHTMQFGAEAFIDTCDLLRQKGISVIGVGKNIGEARKPAIMEKKGTRVAFLGYCSVLPQGHEAGPDRAGCVPMRAATTYEPFEWQPGTPPRVITLANKEDLAAMQEDIRKVRGLADVVVISMHWGIHYAPGLIAMYQKEAGRAAIDAGADLILGHHAHLLKGIEVYKGKVIFYSLGNFAFDFPISMKDKIAHFTDHYGWEADPDYPNYLFPRDSRKAMIATCVISNQKIDRVSFLPCMINQQSQPEVLPGSDSRSADVAEYVDWACRSQKINTRFRRDGDEVVIEV